MSQRGIVTRCGIATACLWGVASSGNALAAPEPAAVVPEVMAVGEITAAFADFRRTCEADGRRLWGHSLCAPLLVVHPETRAFVASEWPGKSGAGPWVGVLPTDVTIANTALTWAGVSWVQLRAPLPEAPARRRALLAHEAFHRLASSLGHRGQEGANAHLDDFEGRTLLQLEWRALASALRSSTASARRTAVEDVLAFRSERRARFASATSEEGSLERHEGLAEYTGVSAAAGQARERRALALENLDDGARRNSFVRAFAYASGPAYGLLLDEAGASATGWRKRALEGADLGDLLGEALRLPAPGPERNVARRETRYEGSTLREAETTRARLARERAEALRKRLVEGPVLRLPLLRMRIQFNPGELVPLLEHGTVYPGARIVDEWGSLSVTSEVLVAQDWKSATVVAPPERAQGSRWQGDGWVLELAPGWSVRAGARPGELALQAPESR